MRTPVFEPQGSAGTRNPTTSLLWPWTQLLASPHTVLFRWKSVIDHATPRAPRRWTTARPRKGTMRSRGRRSSGCQREEEYKGEAAVAAGPGQWWE